MKKIIFLPILSCILLLFTPSINAQENLSLSLEQAKQYAVAHNKSLKNADLSVKKAESDRWQTLATMLPQVSSSFDYQNFLGYEAEISMGAFPVKIPMNPNGSFGITASLTLSGQQIVGSMMGTLAIEMAKINDEKNEITLKNQVTNVYISIIASEKSLALLDSSLQNIFHIQGITENALSAGVAEKTDIDQIKVQVASMRNTINSTKRSIEILYNSMRLLIGSQVDAKITLTDPLEQLINVNKAQQLLSSRFDIQRNHDHQLMEKNLALADKQVWLASVEYFPSVTVFYQYAYKTYFNKEEGFNMTPPNLLGLSLSIPIWSSGVRATKVRSALISKEMTKNDFATVEDNLNIQDKQLRYNLTSAIEDYELQKENIDVSNSVFQSISRKYQYGTASSLDVTNSSNNLVAAQSNYIRAILSMVNAQISLENLLNQ
ncbi:MAG: TolC family protein [Bacteroidales bacterium]|jgi:outer membrane protein TolC|nr:TolC family protein [Bacteroidales bacterium]